MNTRIFWKLIENLNSDFGKISSNLINEDKRIQFLSFEANSQLKR